MLSYTQLRSWRSLCEFLSDQPYKFALPELIDKAHIELRKIYAHDGVEHRRQLKDLYRISFIRWGYHPILRYSNSRRTRRNYEDQGWILVPGWEAKIHFLELVYLLERDPASLPQPWYEAAKQYDLERQRQRRQWLKEKLAARARAYSKAISRVADNRCWFCNREMIALMLDCLHCGKSYEGFEGLSEKIIGNKPHAR